MPNWIAPGWTPGRTDARLLGKQAVKGCIIEATHGTIIGSG
jgi:hypothetical protein